MVFVRNFQQGLLEETEFNNVTNSVYGKILLLTTYFIEEKYRNKGYGKLGIESILSYFTRLGIEFIIVKPYPILLVNKEQPVEEVEKQTMINRLCQFYENFNFEKTYGRCFEPCLVRELKLTQSITIPF